MIKLCIDARMINSSGIGRYLANIIKNLNRDLFNIYLVVNSKNGLSRDLDDFSKIYFFPFIYTIKEQLYFPFKIPSCDIFWSPHFNIPLLPIKAKKRVVTIHDLYHFEYFENLKIKERIYTKFVISKAIEKSDKIITVSNFSAMEIIRHFPNYGQKISIIHNGIDKKMFQIKSSLEIKKIRNKYNLPDKYFLFVGNFKAHKNLKNLIKSFNSLCKQIKDVHLVIIGRKEKLINFEDFSYFIQEENRDKLHVLSSVNDDELGTFYSEAISLVFPSFYEGFGFPPLESMCCKTPVIASKKTSIPEVCGEAAYYIDPNDPEDIARSMVDMVTKENERKKYIELGNIRKEKYSWKESTKQHEKIFKELMI